MSFDVGVTCFQNGEPATFPLALLEQAFAPSLIAAILSYGY